MGTWGADLFSDDIACDVRDSYHDLVSDGRAGLLATDTLLDEWSSQLNDPDVAPVFWLALAATQWRCGRLEDRVKEKAFEIINSGADLRRWSEDSRVLRKRQAVLAKLEKQLRSPQPPPKGFSRPFRDFTNWDVGEIVAYRLKSHKVVLFRVIGFHTDRGGSSPVFELFDWVGDEVPDKSVIKRLEVRAPHHHPFHPGRNQFMIGRRSEQELPKDRVVRTGMKLKPSQAPSGFAVFLWGHLDRLLAATYGIE